MAKRSLDSFSLIVPFSKVDWYDSRFNSKVIEVYSDTGEIREEHERKPIISDVNGIKTRLSVVNWFGSNNFNIVCTSKMLKQHYFNGITPHTVKHLYDYLMSLNLLKMPFDSFLDCQIFDIDIKTDYEQTQTEFDEICRAKRRLVKGSKLYLNQDKRTCQGIQYGNRDKATSASPFIKTYSKGIELFENSDLFRKTYLPAFTNRLLRRTEVTIKNSKMVQYLISKKVLDENPKILRNWVQLSQDKLREIIIFLHNNLERELDMSKIRKPREQGKLSASDYFLLRSLELHLKQGYDIQELVNFMDDYPAKPTVLGTSKSRIKKKLEHLKSILTNTDDTLKRLGVYKVY